MVSPVFAEAVGLYMESTSCLMLLQLDFVVVIVADAAVVNGQEILSC